MIDSSITDLIGLLDAQVKHLDCISHSENVIKHVRGNAFLPSEIVDYANQVASKSTDEKVFQYTANIIYLYGALEHYIESILSEYVSALNKIFPTFDQQNETIKKDYLGRSLTLMKMIERDHPKYKKISFQKVITSLDSALNKKVSKLIPEAFIDTGGGNYNHSLINKCLSNVGLTDFDANVRKYDPFKSLMNERIGSGLSTSQSESLFAPIADLVNRRNELAHGGITDNILSDKEISNYVCFVKDYAGSLHHYLENDLYSKIWSINKSIEYTASSVIKNNTVGIFYFSDLTINAGDNILFHHNENYPEYGCVKIDGIQVDHIEYSSYTAIGTKDVALRFDKKVNKSYQFKLCDESITQLFSDLL